MTSRDKVMTDLRETVARAILQVMREGQFGTLAFADAAIAAMQPSFTQAQRRALLNAATILNHFAGEGLGMAEHPNLYADEVVYDLATAFGLNCNEEFLPEVRRHLQEKRND